MAAIIALLVSAAIWGANSPIMKWALTIVPLFSLAFIRFFLATLIIAPFVVRDLKIKKQDWGKIVLAALLGITLNVSFFFLGLKLTFASNAAFITATIPIFTILAAQFFLKEKLTLRLIFATAMAMTGLVLILGPPIINLGLNHLVGGFFLILASIFWVGYEIFSKKLFKTYSPSVITFYSFAIGSVTFLPLVFLEFLQNPSWILNLSTPGLVGIFYGTVFSSTIAYFSWQYGLSKIPATQASFFFYLDPISGLVVSVILLGERLTPIFIVGGIFVILGVFWAEHKRKVHPVYYQHAKA